jgi:hypothetical protein
MRFVRRLTWMAAVRAASAPGRGIAGGRREREQREALDARNVRIDGHGSIAQSSPATMAMSVRSLRLRTW